MAVVVIAFLVTKMRKWRSNSVVTTPATAPQLPVDTPTEGKADVDYANVIECLIDAISRLRWLALLIFSAGTGLVIYSFHWFPETTDKVADTLIKNAGNIPLVIFELVRGTAFAAVLAAIIFGILSLGRAALDQATRYEKRLMAAHFMHFVLSKYAAQIKEATELDEVVNFIDAWSKNVESAFTKVKFKPPKERNLEVGIDPDGGLVLKNFVPSRSSKGSSAIEGGKD